ncbi:MAG: alpha-hydroxy-acid oxidizing protein, partial [Alphaproteobacteria bacterium]|nr:alpha-hydroxy-acid oxidizing protein [Alphaproteobacteria bacterium]
PVIYGLVLGGWRGVVSVFDYLKNDLRRVMTLAGTQNIDDIKKTKLRLGACGCDKNLHLIEKSL